MKPALWPIIPLLISVPLLIGAELNENKRQIYLLKPLSSSLMLLVAVLAFAAPNVNRGYVAGILIGLIFSFIGDVLLMLQDSKKAFLAGLVAFLLGHVAYMVTLTLYGGFYWPDLVSLAVLAVLAGIVYAAFRPNLGTMRLPVLLYIIIISLMVNRALSTLFDMQLGRTAAWMVAIGAVLFYISDLILACGRFGKPFKYHRISLALYYAGQALIGLSASYF